MELFIDNRVIKDDNIVMTDNNRVIKDDNRVIKDDNRVIQCSNRVIKYDNRVIQGDNRVFKDDNIVIKDDNRVIQCDNRVIKDDNIVTTDDNIVIQGHYDNIVIKDISSLEAGEPEHILVYTDNEKRLIQFQFTVLNLGKMKLNREKIYHFHSKSKYCIFVIYMVMLCY
jgi:hypothetical protein